jgi:hypothetical protein
MKQEGPLSERRAFSKETLILFVLVATAITMAAVICESAMRLSVPTAEPIVVVAAAKAIELAMLKGLLPASY